MESPENTPKVESASEYRRRYGRTMMVLKRLRGTTAEADELCRITLVNTLAPDLWVTVQFLDGSTRSFRPEMIEPAGSGYADRP